jgi:outer membrane immunogenic protein
MKTVIKIAAFALAAGIAMPAAAQDAEPSFTGPRVEGRIGYEFVSASLRNTRDFQGRGQFGDDSIDENFNLGAELGYDAQVGSAVVGAYAGVTFSDARVQAVNGPYQFDLGRNITAGVRAGVPVRGVLIYGKAGYSNGRLKEIILPGGNAALFTNYERNRNGFHLGGGFDVPVMQRGYARFDYTYNQYNKDDIGTTQELQFNRHQLALGLGYRF